MGRGLSAGREERQARRQRPHQAIAVGPNSQTVTLKIPDAIQVWWAEGEVQVVEVVPYCNTFTVCDGTLAAMQCDISTRLTASQALSLFSPRKAVAPQRSPTHGDLLPGLEPELGA